MLSFQLLRHAYRIGTKTCEPVLFMKPLLYDNSAVRFCSVMSDLLRREKRAGPQRCPRVRRAPYHGLALHQLQVMTM